MKVKYFQQAMSRAVQGRSCCDRAVERRTVPQCLSRAADRRMQRSLRKSPGSARAESKCLYQANPPTSAATRTNHRAGGFRVRRRRTGDGAQRLGGKHSRWVYRCTCSRSRIRTSGFRPADTGASLQLEKGADCPDRKYPCKQ